MPNLTTIHLTSGSATDTGTVSSLDNLPALTVTTPLKVDGSGVTQPVSASSLPLPTGAATSALQTTMNTTLGTPMQNSGGSVSAVQSGTWTVQPGNTANTTAWKVDGSAVTQPVSIASLPSGAVTNAGTFAVQSTNAAETTKVIGTTNLATQVGGALTATSNALDVNIKSGAGSGGTAATDAATFTEGTTSYTPIGGVYKSSQTALSTGQGGAVALDANRNMQVNIVAGGGTGGTALADGATFTESTTSHTPVGGEYNSSPGTLSSGKTGAVTLTSDRKMRVQAFIDSSTVNGNGQATMANSAPVVIASDQSALTVGTHAVTQSGTWTVQPGNTANTTAWKVDGSAVTQPVSLASVPSHAVTNAGTFAVQSASAGDTANGSSDSGNPVKIGAAATNVEPTAVTTGQRANLHTDLAGKLITLPYANPENFVSGAITSAMTGTTSTSLVAAPASGLRNYITQITVSNSHATVGTDIIIQDGSGGTTLYTIPAAPAYGGATVTFPVPLRQPTTATAIYCANVTTGSNTKVSASGYKGV